MDLGADVAEHVIYLMLNIGHRVNIAHDWDLERLLTLVGDNGEYKAVIEIKPPLVKEGCSVKNSEVGTSLDVGNNLGLEGQGVKVRQHHLVELLYVHYCPIFSLALSISLSDNKDWENKRGVDYGKLEAAKTVHLVKRFVH